MNSSQELDKLQQFFLNFPELQTIALLFLQNRLTVHNLKECAKSIKDIEEIAISLKLTPSQRLQLQSILLSQEHLKENYLKDEDKCDITIQKQISYENSVRSNEEFKDQNQSGYKSKKKKLPRMLINTSRSRGELKLLKAIIQKNKEFGWKEVFGFDGDVLWSGLDIPWEDMFLANEIRLNRIPGMKLLAHKKMTGFYLNKFREYYPGEFDFYPKTFLVPEDLDEFKEYMSNHPGKLFIAKPTSGSQGDGIILVKKISDLPSLQYTSNEMVVQEYIDKPLLLEGKKFDLRLYVLISNVKPMIAFLNEEGLARFCTEEYIPPTTDNLKNVYMHLTNYSLNKLSPNYKYNEECIEINDGSKRTLTSLWKSLEKAGYDREEIMDNIKELLKRLLVSLQPIIQFHYNVAFEGKDTGKCFHVLGVDILVDQNRKPWLLEINSNPSLNIGHEDLNDPKAKEIISPIDKFVKEKVIEDCLLIVKKPVSKQSNLENYRSYEKIYHSDDNCFKEMDLFQDILYIFGKLSGIKFKTNLTSGKFIKLSSLPGMTNEHLVKASYDIIYQKTIKGSDDNQMSFSSFIKAIEEIVKVLKKEGYSSHNKKEFIEETVRKIKSNI